MEIEGTDRVVAQLASNWLAQYARFLRRTPDLAAKLVDRPDEFELVPMPKILLDRLAVPGIMESGSLGVWDGDLDFIIQLSRAPAQVRSDPAAGNIPEEASELIRRLQGILETGTGEELRQLVSPGYLDQDGRDSEEIRAAVIQLLAATEDRHLHIAELRTALRGPHEIHVTVRGRWQGKLIEQPDPPIGEEIEFQATLGQDEDGTWRISELTAG